MKHMTTSEIASASEVLDQYDLNPAQRTLAEFQLGEEAWARFRSFNAYDAAHVIAAKLERS